MKLPRFKVKLPKRTNLILITTLHVPSNKARLNEYQLCLNENSKIFDEILVVIEDDESEKLYSIPNNAKTIKLGKRATFTDLICIANATKSTIVISNSDIIFDNTIKNANIKTGDFLCLTRHEIINGCLQICPNIGSYDSWCFKPPLNFTADFYLGTFRCDGRLAEEARKSGLKISNPGKSIITKHVHASAFRTWSIKDAIEGPRYEIPPTN